GPARTPVRLSVSAADQPPDGSDQPDDGRHRQEAGRQGPGKEGPGKQGPGRQGPGRQGSTMIDRELFRSASFRFGAIYALLLAISATALAVFLWWATAGLLDRQTEAAVNADAQGLAERWADGGLPALVVTIEDRLAQNIDDDALYLLTDPNMKRIAGNLASWPPMVTDTGPWYELPVIRAGMKSLATVQRYELPGGYHLLIGRDVQVRAQLRKMLTDALLWAAVVVILMATVGALVIRNLFRRTLANISATSIAIAGGDFAQRVKLTG